MMSFSRIQRYLEDLIRHSRDPVLAARTFFDLNIFLEDQRRRSERHVVKKRLDLLSRR